MEVQRSSSQVGEPGGFYYGRAASGTVSVIGRMWDGPRAWWGRPAGMLTPSGCAPTVV